MATAVKVDQQDVGLSEILHVDLTLGASYTKGGEALNAADLPFRSGHRIDSVEVEPIGGKSFEFVPDATSPHLGYLKVRDARAQDDFTLNRPALAIGVISAAEIAHGAFTKVVAGAIAEVAAAEVAFTATTHDIAPDAQTPQEAYYTISVQAGGTVIVTKGATADEGLAVPAAVPAGEALVGYVKVVVAAGATPFDATTDDLDAAHLTTTFEDWDGEEVHGTDLSSVTVRARIHGR